MLNNQGWVQLSGTYISSINRQVLFNLVRSYAYANPLFIRTQHWPKVGRSTVARLRTTSFWKRWWAVQRTYYVETYSGDPEDLTLRLLYVVAVVAWCLWIMVWLWSGTSCTIHTPGQKGHQVRLHRHAEEAYALTLILSVPPSEFEMSMSFSVFSVGTYKANLICDELNSANLSYPAFSYSASILKFRAMENSN